MTFHFCFCCHNSHFTQLRWWIRSPVFGYCCHWLSFMLTLPQFPKQFPKTRTRTFNRVLLGVSFWPGTRQCEVKRLIQTKDSLLGAYCHAVRPRYPDKHEIFNSFLKLTKHKRQNHRSSSSSLRGNNSPHQQGQSLALPHLRGELGISSSDAERAEHCGHKRE